MEKLSLKTLDFDWPLRQHTQGHSIFQKGAIAMLITPRQIKAARALLDWSAEDLGKRVGASKATISLIETGKSSGSVEMLDRIIHALQGGGVEFTPDGGIRPSRNRANIQLYHGHGGFCSFFDDIYDAAANIQDANICVANSDESQFLRWLGSYAHVHSERMAQLSGPKIRVLLQDRRVYPETVPYCDYRWIEAERFADVSMYLYADKVAFIEFSDRDVNVTVVESKAVTEAQRKMFDLAWLHAKALASS